RRPCSVSLSLSPPFPTRRSSDLMPFANRRDPAVADLIGYVANTLPLRVDLTGNPSFAALMTRVASELLDADAHQEAPFDLIVNRDRKSTRLNSSHVSISYAVFCL